MALGSDFCPQQALVGTLSTATHVLSAQRPARAKRLAAEAHALAAQEARR